MVIVSVVDRPVASLKAAGGTRLGWGAQMASADGAEWGEVWRGVSPPQATRESGERRELPQPGLGQSPGQKCIFGIFLGHRTLLVDRKMQNFAQCNAQN